MSTLAVGDPVRVKVRSKWIKGLVTTVCSQPNTYVVQTNCGRLFRRNREAINVDKSFPKQRNSTKFPVRLKSTPRPGKFGIQTFNFIYDFEGQTSTLERNSESKPEQDVSVAEEGVQLEPLVEAAVEERTEDNPVEVEPPDENFVKKTRSGRQYSVIPKIKLPS